MKLARQHWRMVLRFLPDLCRGSWILVQLAVSGARRLHRCVSHPAAILPALQRTRNAKPAPAAPGQSRNEPASDAEQPPVAPAAVQETKKTTGRAAAAKKPPAWTLDRLVGVAVFGWTAWCFTRHPLTAGWDSLTAVLPAARPWLLGLWISAAWLAAQHDRTHRPVPPAARAAQDTGPRAGDVRAAGHWLWHLVCVRVQDAVAAGRRGIHLKTLLEEPGIPEAWTVTTLREHCERLGIPVKPMQIRGSGTGPTHGVHVDDLTTALGRPLEEAITVLEKLLAQGAETTTWQAMDEAPLEPVEEAPADPGKRWTFEELLGAYLGGSASPIRTPGPTPLPGPSPTPPGRG